MAYLSDDITDPSVYSDYPDVLRLETTNKVYGGKYTDGEDDKGISNLQAMQLMERDNYILNRVGEASVAPVGDVPGKPGIASLDTTGKVPDGQIPAAITRNTSVQTLTNKTINFNDNTLTGVASITTAQTLTNKTINFNDNTLQNVASLNTAQTLTNKTIDAKDNSVTCTPTVINTTPADPLLLTKEVNLVISAPIELDDGPYVGYNVPVTATAATTVTYEGTNGSTTDDLDAGQTVNYIWKGSYWGSVSNVALLVYVSEDTTVAPTMPINYIVDTSGVTLTFDSGAYPTCRVDVYAQQDCYVSYTGEGGTVVTDTLHAGDYLFYTWLDTYWKYQSVPVLGVDDNKEAFGFNIESMVRAGETAHITGTDADGNAFEYGIENLITKCEEQSYSTTEVKTNETWIDGKPIYRKVVPFTTPSSNTVIQIATGIVNAETFTHTECFLIDTSNITVPLTYYTGSMDYAFYYVSQTTIGIMVNGAVKYSRPAYAILEYTKTE